MIQNSAYHHYLSKRHLSFLKPTYTFKDAADASLRFDVNAIQLQIDSLSDMDYVTDQNLSSDLV